MMAQRRGASTTLLVLSVVVVLAVAGAAYYYSGLGVKTTTSTTSLCCTTSSSSSSTGTLRAVLEIQPGTPLASSDVVANYTMAVTLLGSVSSPVDVSSSVPSGLQVMFSPSEVQPGTGSNSVAVSFKVLDSVAPGAYHFNVTLTSGGGQYSQSFVVQVVKYLVVTVGTSFIPANITVPSGSTVYWMRLNGAIDQYDNGDHNVAFRTMSVTSPTLGQYQDYSYVFSAAGTYQYYCTFHPAMTGEVVVT